MINRLHKECVVVKSWHFNVLLDLPRQRMFRYPENSDMSVTEEGEHFGDLLKNELLLPVNVDHGPFPAINTRYLIPVTLTTLVWEFSDALLQRIIDLVKELNTQFLSILFKEEITAPQLEQVLKTLEGTPLRSIDLFFLFENSFTADYFNELRHINSRVVLVLSESPQPVSRFFDDQKGIIGCGRLDLASETTYFNIHIRQYVESLSYNAYFNNRLFVSASGDLRMDVNAAQVLGNMDQITDMEQWIAENEYIRTIWESSKEKTDVCLNCEFRNICLDNRIPQQRSDGSYYHLTECNYNPYLAKWKGEEGYRSLSDCGVVTNAHEFRIDREQLEKINQELWG